MRRLAQVGLGFIAVMGVLAFFSQVSAVRPAEGQVYGFTPLPPTTAMVPVPVRIITDTPAVPPTAIIPSAPPTSVIVPIPAADLPLPVAFPPRAPAPPAAVVPPVVAPPATVAPPAAVPVVAPPSGTDTPASPAVTSPVAVVPPSAAAPVATQAQPPRPSTTAQRPPQPVRQTSTPTAARVMPRSGVAGAMVADTSTQVGHPLMGGLAVVAVIAVGVIVGRRRVHSAA